MAETVGHIRIKTKLDNNDLKKGLSDAEAIVKQTANGIRDAGGKVSDAVRMLYEGISPDELRQRISQAAENIRNFDAELEDVKHKMASQNIDPDINTAELEGASASVQNLAMKRDELTGSIDRQTRAMEYMSSILKEVESDEEKTGAAAQKAEEDIRKMGDSAQKAGNGAKRAFSGMMGSMSKMVMGILGARTAYSLLRRSVSECLNQNEDLANQMSGIWQIIGAAILPVVQTIVHWITVAISWINALIKAFTGIDLIANANAKSLNKQAKATGAAGAAAKKAERQLAGFDEMNKLQSNDSGGGSSGGGGGIGGGGGLAFKPADVGEGIDVEKITSAIIKIEEIAGGCLLGVGALLAFTGANIPLGIGMMVAGAALLASAATLKWGEAENDTESGIMKLEAIAGGALLAIGALLLFSGANIPLGLGMLAAGGFLLAKAIAPNWDNIVSTFKERLEKVKEYFQLLWSKMKEGWQTAKNWVVETWGKIPSWFNEKIITPVANFFTNLWTKLKDGWTSAKNKVVEIWGAVSGWFRDKIITPVSNFFSNLWGELKSGASTAWQNVKNVFSSVTGFFTNIWNTIKSTFTKIGSTIGNAIGDAFKTVVNSIINFAENTINKFIRAINTAIDLINKIPGVNIGKLNTLSIPRLARGGIAFNPGKGVPAVIGEAGREAVLPLDNYTEWMDELADKINGSGSPVIVRFIMDGTVMYEKMLQIKRKKEFAANGVI